LPNGDAVVSRDTGTGTGITRIRARDRAHPQFNWAPVDGTNGLALDPSGKWLYATNIYKSLVYRIKVSDPSQIKTIATLPSQTLPDDMTTDAKGGLYIAAPGVGDVLQLNPATGASCTIASNLGLPTSVRFGAGPGWSSRSLYVSDGLGTLRRLTPP